MIDGNLRLDALHEDVLTCQVSDEALEAMAESQGDKGRNFTLAFCSGLSTCPE